MLISINSINHKYISKNPIVLFFLLKMTNQLIQSGISLFYIIECKL